MGVAAADFDNDGFTDLYVTGVHENVLYRNHGDGTFEDCTSSAGVAGDGTWSIAAGWLDYDNDGLLDLFVARYVAWDPATEPYCGDPKNGLRSYCDRGFIGPWPTYSTGMKGMAASAMSPPSRELQVHLAREWVSPSEITTEMAGWTCSSPMIQFPISCFTILETAGSKKLPCRPGLLSTAMERRSRPWALIFAITITMAGKICFITALSE